MPDSSNTKPANCSVLNCSPKKKYASSADPTGSPRMATATKVAVSRRNAQLNVVWPINCGPSASATMNTHADPGSDPNEMPVVMAAARSSIAAAEEASQIYAVSD